MDNKRKAAEQELANVVAYLEGQVMAQSDEELEREIASVGSPSDARYIVSTQLARRPLTVRRGSARVGRIATKLRLLRALLAARPDLAPSLSMAFASGQTPSEVEVEGVMNELVRRGVLETNKDTR